MEEYEGMEEKGVPWVEGVLDGALVGGTRCKVLVMRLGLLFWDWACSS